MVSSSMDGWMDEWMDKQYLSFKENKLWNSIAPPQEESSDLEKNQFEKTEALDDPDNKL